MSSNSRPRRNRPGRLSQRAALIRRLPAAESPSEVWKPIPDYVGLYEVSDEGRIRSLPRAVDARSTLGARYDREIDGLEMTPTPNRDGRLSVCLCKDGRRSDRGLADLVLTSFGHEKPAGHVVAHADGDKGNCALVNLSWRPRGSTRARPA